MNVVKIDLVDNYAVDIGASYKVQIQLCNSIDLTGASGICQVRTTADSTDVILSPVVRILSATILELEIPVAAYNGLNLNAGNFVYDVLIIKGGEQHYVLYGRIALVKRVTKVVA